MNESVFWLNNFIIISLQSHTVALEFFFFLNNSNGTLSAKLFTTVGESPERGIESFFSRNFLISIIQCYVLCLDIELNDYVDV